MPDMSCMCFKFCSLSFRMNEMHIAGIIAKPIAMTKAMIVPLILAARYLSFSVTGYDSVVT